MTSAKQIYLGVRRAAPTPPLPYDAEVEYIKSTGSQWIQTDWTPDLSENLVVDGYFGFATSNRGMLLSAYTGIGTDRNLSLELYTSATLRMYVNGNEIKAAHSPATINVLFKMAVEYSASTGSVYLYNGGFVGSGTVLSGNRVRSKRTARLGNDYRNSYPYGMFGPFKVFNPYLVLDMAPVRFTNELGQSEGAMYDRVSGQLFRNAGTGAFTIGPDKS